MSIISDALKKAQEQSKKCKGEEVIAPSPPETGRHRKNKVRVLSVIRVLFLVAFMSGLVFIGRVYKPEIDRVLSGLTTKIRQSTVEPARLKAGGPADETVAQVEAPVVEAASRPPATEPKVYTVPKAPPKPYTLSGIVFDKASPYAVINDTILKKGDCIGAAELISIEKNKVTLLSGDKEITLKLK